MTDAELQAIRERCEKATPGPWEYKAVEIGSPSNCLNPIVDSGAHSIARLFSDESTVAGMTSDAPPAEEAYSNAAFIANARTDIPALLAEVERLRKLAGDCRTILETIQADEQSRDAGLWQGEMIPRTIRLIDNAIGERSNA